MRCEVRATEFGLEVRLGRRRVGLIKGRVYVTRRWKNDHLFRKFNGFGISEAVLYKLINMNVNRILIIFSKNDGEVLLESSLEDWFRKGIKYENGRNDKQRILKIEYMKEK